MTLSTIAHGVAALCREGRYTEAQQTYFAPDVVSVEPTGEPREVVGLEALLGKAAWFESTFEVHATTVAGPFLGEDQFVLRFTLDVTEKASGRRFEMDELAIYTVREGKVTREQFFYHSAF